MPTTLSCWLWGARRREDSMAWYISTNLQVSPDHCRHTFLHYEYRHGVLVLKQCNCCEKYLFILCGKTGIEQDAKRRKAAGG